MVKRRRKSLFGIFSIISLFILIFSYLYVTSNNLLRSYALSDFNALTASACYRAIDLTIENGYDFSSLIKTERNADGEIVFVSANGYAVNKLASELSKNAFKILDDETDNGVEVPFGAFTGIRLIAGAGNKINVKLLSIGSVKSEMITEFEQAGINQTRQTTYVKIKCEATLSRRSGNEVVSNEISVLIYDNLIVGKVPNIALTPIVLGKG